jgi:hypothetical protein
MTFWRTIGGLLLTYEGGITVNQIVERHKHFREAREYADQAGKPLLTIGMKRMPWQTPNGDVTVDIDPIVENLPGGVYADERDMPFSDKEFAVCLNAHTLEHLPTASDVEIAINECLRVADRGIFLCPSPYDLISNFVCPAHYLRLWFDQVNNRIRVSDNRWRSGLGFNWGPKITQAIIVDEMPEIIKISGAYVL